MFRTQRVSVSVIGALVLGPLSLAPVSLVTGSLATVSQVAAPAALAASALLLAGCQDESQPEYWVEKLEDKAWRPRAIKRLEQFFEDAATKANKNMDAPEVKALVDKIAVPLTQTYVNNYSDFDENVRVSLIKLISALRDPRTEPALTKALDEFGKRGLGGEDIKWAARAAADMKLESVADEVLASFFKLRADSKEGAGAYRDFNEAMMRLASKGWTPRLVEALAPPMELPAQGEQNKEKVSEFRNQQFWQTTAAQILGEIGDASAVEPLIRVTLDPAKANLHATAILALVKIGKPSVERASKLIANQDQGLAEFAAQRLRQTGNAPAAAQESPHVRMAAVILGTVGHAAGAAPMIEALKREKSEDTRAVLLRELAKLPTTPEIEKAFQDGYATLSDDAVIPPGQNAQQALAESAATFFDPAIVNWLLEQASSAKGDEETKKGTQAAITVSTIKLATAAELDAVKGAVKSYGTQLERDVLAQAEGLLNSCKNKVECYLAAVDKDENQDKKNQFIGIKAAYMVGILGKEATRDELVKRMGNISNPAVRYTAGVVIDHLSPKGSAAAADELQKLVDANVKSADSEKIAGDAPIKQVIYRLRSRAQS
jgi:HEAT repeat protein